MIKSDSIEKAMEWAQKAPLAGGAVLEVRRVQAVEDFKDQIPAEIIDAEKKLREKHGEKK